jgi:hypothetical protein
MLAVTTLALPAAAFASCPSGNSSQGQILGGIGNAGGDCSGGITNTVSTIVQILSVIAGIVAVIMVIVSGLRYITSGGDSGKVGAAKNSLIYALVGLAIAVLAQFLVHFVINKASM